MLILSIAVSFLYLAPSLAYASDSSLFGFCNKYPTAAPCQDRTNANPVLHVIQVATAIIAIIVGIAAVIMIIVSGIRLITSGGNQEAVANARKRITSAIIGLVIVALSWTIINFVIDNLIK